MSYCIVSPDHGAKYPSDFDGTFLTEEEKEEYIGQTKTRDGWYRCPTCGLLWEEIENAMTCHTEDVR